MFSKREAELIERFKKSGRTLNTAMLNVPFRFIIRITSTLGLPGKEISSDFEDQIFSMIKQEAFSSPITALGIFPQIFDPLIYLAPDNVSYKKKTREVQVSLNINYKLWCDSTRANRIEMLHHNVVESIRRVPENLLISNDREELLSLADKAAKSLRGHE